MSMFDIMSQPTAPCTYEGYYMVENFVSVFPAVKGNHWGTLQDIPELMLMRMRSVFVGVSHVDGLSISLDTDSLCTGTVLFKVRGKAYAAVN